MKETMIEFIRSKQFYENGTLERMTETEIREIFENLIEWVEG